MQASWNGAVIACSDNIVTVEGNAYFPPEAIDPACFQPSDHRSVCEPRQRSPGPPAVELRGRACRLGGLPAAVAPAAPAGGGERLRSRSRAGGCSPGGGGLRIGAGTTRDGMLGWRLPADREGLAALDAHLSRWFIPAGPAD